METHVCIYSLNGTSRKDATGLARGRYVWNYSSDGTSRKDATGLARGDSRLRLQLEWNESIERTTQLLEVEKIKKEWPIDVRTEAKHRIN